MELPFGHEVSVGSVLLYVRYLARIFLTSLIDRIAANERLMPNLADCAKNKHRSPAGRMNRSDLSDRVAGAKERGHRIGRAAPTRTPHGTVRNGSAKLLLGVLPRG